MGAERNSIEIQDSTLNEMVVQKDFSRVRVFAKGTTSISHTIIKSGAKLEQEQGNEGFQSISVQGTTVNDVVQLEGTFVKVDLKSVVTVEISSQSVVTLLETQAGSEGSGIKMLGNAILEQIILQAAAKVTGEGSILNALINVEGVSFEQIVKKYTLGELVKLVVIGGKEVTGNSPVILPGSTNTSPAPNDEGSPEAPEKPTDGKPAAEPVM